MEDKLPNFLIVGSAKSGTTSLYHYLKQHPDVYLPEKREGRFFSIMENFNGQGDEVEFNKSIIKSFEVYKSLFSGTNSEKAIGDISTDYLYYYENSTKKIKSILGDTVRIIIILRNPIERAYSQYLHNVRDGKETLSFENALKTDNLRRKQNWVWGWYYKNIGFYYKQVKAYIENFKQVRIYLYDDLLSDELCLMSDLFAFLEVDSLFVPDMSVKYNVSGIYKNKIIYNLLFKQNLFKSVVRIILDPFYSREKRQKFVEKLRSKNLEKPQMKAETREYLNHLYRDDILRLQSLINRDLSSWLN